MTLGLGSSSDRSPAQIAPAQAWLAAERSRPTPSSSSRSRYYNTSLLSEAARPHAIGHKSAANSNIRGPRPADFYPSRHLPPEREPKRSRHEHDPTLGHRTSWCAKSSFCFGGTSVVKPIRIASQSRNVHATGFSQWSIEVMALAVRVMLVVGPTRADS